MSLTSSWGPTPTELLALALALVRLDLIEAVGPRSRVDALHAALRRHRGGDDALTLQVAHQVAAMPLWEDPGLLLKTLEGLSVELLEPRHGYPVRRTRSGCDELSRILDPDLLAAFCPGLELPLEDGLHWSAVPRAHHHGVLALLANGSVDTHIHLGGALPPLFYWVGLMSAQTPLEQLRHFPDPRRGHAGATTWRLRVAQAMWLRYWLAGAMIGLEARGASRLALPPLGSGAWAEFVGEAGAWWDQRAAPGWPIGGEALPAAMKDAGSAVAAVRHLVGARSRFVGASYVDPLVQGRAGTREGEAPHHYAYGERCLFSSLAGLLRLAREHERAHGHRPGSLRPGIGSDRCGSCECFRAVTRATFAYISVRNAFHQLAIHDSGVEGLMRFQEAFHRRSSLSEQRSQRGRRLVQARVRAERHRTRVALEEQLVQAFDESDFAGSRAPRRRVELRVALAPSREPYRYLRAMLSGIADYLHPTAAGAAGREQHQIGLILHFLKRGDTAARLIRSEHLMRQLAALLRSKPALRPFIVGIDAAGSERKTPPRHYMSVFEAARILQARFRHQGGASEPRIRLGMTYHAGEDPWDLLTGLRHLDEATTLLVGSGGRIGHGLALAIPPKHYYGQRPKGVELPLGTHLLDLIWAWGRCTERVWSQEANRLEHAAHVLTAGNPGLSRAQLEACWRAMGLPTYVELVEAGSAPGSPRHSEAELIEILGLRRNPRDLTWLNPEPWWLRCVEKLQKLVRGRLERLGITLEVNPTSNLLVGNFADYSELPYHTMVNAKLPVSINTDDPGLFMSSLPLEFERLHQAFSSKLPGTDVLNWLEHRLKDADRSSFLLPSTPAGRQAFELLRWTL